MENKIKSYVLALLTLSATSLFAADFETTKFGAKAGVPFASRLEPYRHCKILSGKPEMRPWLYENLRKHLKENEAK